MKLKKVVMSMVMIVLLFTVSGKSVLANGTKTQVYIANEIIAELQKNGGYVEIEGQGKVEVPDNIKNAILNQQDAFRAGAVGPDFYPSFLVGLRGIHANESGYYLEKLIQDYIDNPPADATERQKIEAFLLGMQVHYSGDIISRTEFNELAGGDFPRISYEMINSKSEANVLLRYSAIEGYYDSILPEKGYSYEIAAPIDFVAKYMAFNGENGGNIKRGLNDKYKYSSDASKSKVGTELPLVLFVKYQNEVVKFNNTLNKNGVTGAISSATQIDRWIGGIEGSIEDWIRSNEKAASRVLNGESSAYALSKEYAAYVNGPLENMIPLRDVIKILKTGSGVGFLDEVLGVSDSITGEVTDFLSANIAGGNDTKSSNELAKILINDSALFSDDTDVLKNKIKIAGDKSVREAKNLAKLTLLGQTGLKQVIYNTGIEDRISQKGLKLDAFSSIELKEAHTGLVVTLKTGDEASWKSVTSWLDGSMLKGFGTDSDVNCYVTFKDGTVVTKKLDKPGYNDFETGDTDDYYVEFDKVRKLSEIQNIKIGITKYIDEWYLNSAVLKTVGGRKLTECYPEMWFKDSSTRAQIYPFVPKKQITMKIKNAKGYLWKGYGTDGDVYARVSYSDGYQDYLLDKSLYNDFENGTTSSYIIPVKHGYNYSDITSVGFYRRNGDDWRVDDVWIHVNGREYAHKHYEKWIDRNIEYVCGRINGYDTNDVPNYKDISYGELYIIPEFFRDIYSLDKKNVINDEFFLCETSELKDKVYNKLVVSEDVNSNTQVKKGISKDKDSNTEVKKVISKDKDSNTEVKKIQVRIITRNGNWSKAYGTDGDVYARVNYGSFYRDYILDKSGYNDFEKGDDDTYDIDLERGYDYSDVTSVGFYKANGDDWDVQEAWVLINGREYAHKEYNRGVGRLEHICGRINGFDTE
ncbi:PLAT/LH2 domain-containing protein [Oceanirhabdus seepicola]|uniref:PLAT domain-containing protein n=1 Tax=Oceanirhabdus seepicola TaxID=2828781 RepID=A0A9J6P369_9CLOT|nr:PLAT/LH2 domain-containing protein [Oceanirhabdus seepicola]MCM1989944.1 hypothetical protein [Oceanirhabdus seepicola]